MEQKFIEVTGGSGNFLIRIDAIDSIFPLSESKGCKIYMMGSSGHDDCYRVKQSYEEIKSLLRGSGTAK